MFNFKHLFASLLLTLAACSPTEPKQATTTKVFTTPSIPAILTSDQQKRDFILTHYWDNFDFTDTTLIARADYTEQAFADFANILPIAPMPIASRGIDTLMHRAKIDSVMYAHFMELSEKYFYDPNSPFRNEELYIVVLRNIIANPTLDELLKSRPRYQLALALKNRVGGLATDFTYVMEDGTQTRLYSHDGNPLLVMFFNPDCPTCKITKDYITQHKLESRMKIVYINMESNPQLDSLYDLRASPTLYMLDKQKKILLKDASIEQVEQYLVAPEK